MTTIKEVTASFEEGLRAISVLDQTLAAEHSALKRNAFLEKRELTAEQVKRREEISATRGKLTEAMETLALDTVNALENASEVDRLLGSIEQINQQIQGDLDHLEKIEENAAKIRSVAESLASIVSSLSGFRSSLIE